MDVEVLFLRKSGSPISTDHTNVIDKKNTKKPHTPIAHTPASFPKQDKDIRKFFSIGGLTVLSIASLPWIAIYWSQYCLQSTLDTCSHGAH